MTKVCLNCKKVFNAKRSAVKYCSPSCSWSCPLHHKLISISLKGQNAGEKSGKWVGDKVKYRPLHKWVKSRFPKTEFCQICKVKPSVDLANKSQEYKRDLSDWQWLCRKCHMVSDGRLKRFLENAPKARLLTKYENGRFIFIGKKEKAICALCRKTYEVTKNGIGKYCGNACYYQSLRQKWTDFRTQTAYAEVKAHD